MSESSTKPPKTAIEAAADKQLEAIFYKHAKAMAKDFGSVRVLGQDESDDPRLKIANEVFQAAARRKVN